MIDLGAGNNNKINWAMDDKQEFIDIVEVVYSGGLTGLEVVLWYLLRTTRQSTDINAVETRISPHTILFSNCQDTFIVAGEENRYSVLAVLRGLLLAASGSARLLGRHLSLRTLPYLEVVLGIYTGMRFSYFFPSSRLLGLCKREHSSPQVRATF